MCHSFDSENIRSTMRIARVMRLIHLGWSMIQTVLIIPEQRLNQTRQSIVPDWPDGQDVLSFVGLWQCTLATFHYKNLLHSWRYPNKLRRLSWTTLKKNTATWYIQLDLVVFERDFPLLCPTLLISTPKRLSTQKACYWPKELYLKKRALFEISCLRGHLGYFTGSHSELKSISNFCSNLLKAHDTQAPKLESTLHRWHIRNTSILLPQLTSEHVPAMSS